MDTDRNIEAEFHSIKKAHRVIAQPDFPMGHTR